ncbi:hypothetical protein OS493_039651, partial [Desmophyllum pertusum]
MVIIPERAFCGGQINILRLARPFAFMFLILIGGKEESIWVSEIGSNNDTPSQDWRQLVGKALMKMQVKAVLPM